MPIQFYATAAAAVLLAAVTPLHAQQGQPGSAQLTIYNQNFGLVKDVRQVALKKGVNTIIIDDVAALIQPA